MVLIKVKSVHFSGMYRFLIFLLLKDTKNSKPVENEMTNTGEKIEVM